MESIIYTYGGGEALFKILNGIAMVFNSGLADNVISLMTIAAISWTGVQAIIQQSFVPNINWIVKYTLITTLLIQPKSTIWVTDTVHNNARYKVDNLPVGLVLPASLISTIGYGVTNVFEQAFGTIGNISYEKYGTAFGASLISQARNYKIQDADFRENMESFISNCVKYDVMIGKKYSPSELRDSKNIWNLVTSKASNIRMFNFREQGTGERSLITCSAGKAKLEAYWNDDINILTNRFTNTILGQFGTNSLTSNNNSTASTQSTNASNNTEYLGQAFIKNLETVSDFFGNKNSATDNIKQLMMINAMNDIPSSYGVVRAKHQQEETWNITGQLARENLPIMHAVFAGLIYSSFALIVGLLVLPNGWRVFWSFLGLLAWIELWPPLFAVLNLVVNLSSKAAGGQIATGFTMNNISQVISSQNNISAMAGYLMASIPFISYALIKGGVGQFVHLAGQLSGATQSAAANASQEVTSGNRSFDNRSIANSQWFNTSGFKTDLNATTRMGHQEYQASDGTLVKETLGGGKIFHAGPGITTSVGSKSMSMNNVDSLGIHKSLSNEKSLMDSEQKEYSKMEQSMHRQASEFIARLASGEGSGEHFNYSRNSSYSKTLIDNIDQTKELHERYGYSWSQAAELALSGGLGLKAGRGGGELGKMPISTTNADEKSSGGLVDGVQGIALGIIKNFGYADGGLSMRADAKDMSEQAYTEQKGVTLRKGYTENTEDIVKAAKEMQFNTNQSNEKSLADSLTGSYEKMHQLRDSISVHKQNIERFQETIDHSNVSSFSVGDEFYHKELKFIANQRDDNGFKYGMHGAQRLMEQGGPKFEELNKAFMSKEAGHLQRMPNNFDLNAKYEAKQKENINQTIDHSDIEQVKNQSKKEIGDLSVNKEAIGKFDSMTDSKLDEKINNRKQANYQKAEVLQTKTNELEGKRFYPGLIGNKKNENEKVDD